jgi:hypothetical protein
MRTFVVIEKKINSTKVLFASKSLFSGKLKERWLCLGRLRFVIYQEGGLAFWRWMLDRPVLKKLFFHITLNWPFG